MASTEQTIEIQLLVGSRVTIFEDVDLDDGGFSATDVFYDTVTEFNPNTGSLRFENSDMGYAEFKEMLNEYDSVQVVRE